MFARIYRKVAGWFALPPRPSSLQRLIRNKLAEHERDLLAAEISHRNAAALVQYHKQVVELLREQNKES